jgi:hypothetical protein
MAPSEESSKAKDLRTIESILRFLAKRSFDCWSSGRDLLRNPLDAKARDTFNYLCKLRPPTRLEQLNHLIKNEPSGGLRLEVDNLYLPPFYDHDKQFVPILNLAADFSKPAVWPKLNLRIALMTINYEKGMIFVFGSRFEMPHEGSDHNYCHQQFTRKPLLQGSAEESCCEMTGEWLPEHLPCTLMPAKTPVEHMLCMLVSLYGLKARDLIIEMDIGGDYKKPLYYFS